MRPFWQLKSDCVRVSRTSHPCLLPQHSLLRSASPRAPRFSEAPALFLALKTPARLCGTDFAEPTFPWLAGGRRQPGPPRACRTKRPIVTPFPPSACQDLTNERGTLGDRDGWGSPVLAPRTHCPSVYPSPWDQPNQMAAYGAITQSFSCAQGRQECEVSQRI